MKLEDLKIRVEQLQREFEGVAKLPFVKPQQFQHYVDELNNCTIDASKELHRELPHFEILDSDYSSSQKTIVLAGIDRLTIAYELLIKTINEELAKWENNSFKCFLVNNKCPHHIRNGRYKFFVGMPFADKNDDAFRFGIIPVLDTCGGNYYRADEKYERRELMCKICQAIQEATFVIIDISGANPNVMFELGLACGLEKSVILLKDSNANVPTDLNGIEYVEYKNAYDLQQQLTARLKQWGVC